MAKSATPKESAVIPIQPNARSGANANKQESAPAAPAESKTPKKRKWLKWMLVTAVLSIAVAICAVWYFTSDEAPSNAAPAAAPEKPAVFVPFDQFTVNLLPENGDQYLQTALVVKVSNNTTMEAIKQQMPEIRYRLILVLSSKRPSDVVTVEGKKALAAEIAAQVKQTLSPALREDVSAVFFTSFVVQ